MGVSAAIADPHRSQGYPQIGFQQTVNRLEYRGLVRKLSQGKTCGLLLRCEETVVGDSVVDIWQGEVRMVFKKVLGVIARSAMLD